MSASRLALEFVLIDGGSAVAKRLAQGLRALGDEGEKAADQVDRMVDKVNDGLKLLGTSRAMKEGLLDPGLQAAGSLQEALHSLEVNLDQASVAETRRTLLELSADAARVAGPTKFSQEQIIGVQTELLKAGLAQEDVVGKGGAAESVAQLATAEKGMTAESATDAVLTLGAIFRLSGDQYAQAADLMMRAAGASNTGPDEIREALKMAPGAGKMDRREVLGALGALSSGGIKGSLAGTALNSFLLSSAKNEKKMRLGMYDQDGRMKALPDVAAQLRKRFGGMDERQRTVALAKAFDTEGARFAEALMRDGAGSIEDVLTKMDSSRSLQERVAIMSGGYKAQLEALGGSVQTALSTLFTPALDPLGAAAAQLNTAASNLNEAAQDRPGLAKTVSYGALGAVGVAGALGAARMAQGGIAGAGALKSLGKLGGLKTLLGTAGGVAAGKAAEAAAGVTPVFVTNWPSALGAAGAAGAAAATGADPVGNSKGAKLAAFAARASLAGGVGYAVGTKVNESYIKGSVAEDVMQASFAGALLNMGGRMFMSDEDIRNTERVRDQGLNTLKGMLGLKVDVHVDPAGQARVQASFDDGTRAAARSGAY